MKYFLSFIVLWFFVLSTMFNVIADAEVGGMDFTNMAMTSYSYELPDFDSETKALTFAGKVKWNEEVMILVKYKIDILEKLSSLKDKPITDENIKYSQSCLLQRRFLITALNTMEHYKEKGIRGEDVGSMTRISMMPLLTQNDYVAWK